MNLRSELLKRSIWFLNIGGKLIRSKSGLLVLMYHSIEDKSAYPYSININSFEKQIKYLKDIACFIRADEIFNLDNKKLNILLSFDDGYKNNYSVVYPILQEYNIPAIMFLTTNFVECGRTFLIWQEIREMSNSNLITFGSHCKNHLNLTSLNEADAFQEINQSRIILQDKLGKRIDFFSYPSGGYNKEIMNYVKEAGYKAGFRDRMKNCEIDKERFLIGRVSIDKHNETMDKFLATLAAARPIKKIVLYHY